MPHFNEHALELSIMELFQREGYTYTNGEEIHKEVSDVLLRDDMRLYLRSRYKTDGITPLEIERVLAILTANVGFSLYEQNRHTYQLMTEGFSLKREDAALPDLFIEPIDFTKDGTKNNMFRIVNQLETQGSERRIPDGIVYVNGLPVVVLEFKSAVKEDTTIMDAYTQLTVRYRRDIPDLFKYNAFVVISDGVNNKYGSMFSSYDFFYAWRKVEADDKATDGINSLLTMVRGLFRKERLLSVIKDFVFFPDSSKSEKKVVCRYPQFFATHKLFDNIRLHSRLQEGGDGKGGTYFGATGCGKSITMLFLSRMLMRTRDFASPTIVLITDRTDLDDQLSKLFGTAKKLKSAFNLCSNNEEISDAEREEIHYFTGVRSIIYKLTIGDTPDASQMNRRVSEMIEEAIQSEGVEEIIQIGNDKENLDVLSEEYMERLGKLKLPNTKVKLMERLLKTVITEFKKVNKVKGVDFSKRLNALVDKYNDRRDSAIFADEVLTEVANQMADLLKELNKEKKSFLDLGISYEEKAFYDILKAIAKQFGFEYPENKLLKLAAEIKKIVADKSKYTDWSTRDDIKAELKMDLILVLAEYGYPPVTNDEVFKEILEQAENFKKYNG